MESVSVVIAFLPFKVLFLSSVFQQKNLLLFPHAFVIKLYSSVLHALFRFIWKWFFYVAEHWTPKTCQYLYDVHFIVNRQWACVSLLNVQPWIKDVSCACWINPIVYFWICFHPEQYMNCHTKLTGFDDIPGALET